MFCRQLDVESSLNSLPRHPSMATTTFLVLYGGTFGDMVPPRSHTLKIRLQAHAVARLVTVATFSPNRGQTHP
ncbi:hypothetical protein AB1N83_009409 [Pleurotus pulmonarius]